MRTSQLPALGASLAGDRLVGLRGSGTGLLDVDKLPYLPPSARGLTLAALEDGAVPMSQLGADRLRPRAMITDWRQPGDSPSDPVTATAWLERALASSAPSIVIPGDMMLRINAPTSTSARLVGKTLCGPGGLDFVAGNLRLGSAAEVLDGLRIRGSSRSNAASGLSILSGASDVLVRDPDIAETQYNGVNINPSSGVRIIGGKIRLTGGGGTYDPTSQGCGIYAASVSGLDVVGTEISEVYGQGGLFLSACAGASVRGLRVKRTQWRSIMCWGANTGVRIIGGHLEDSGALFGTSTSAVGRNAIFAAGNPTPHDVLVMGVTIDRAAENGIEGHCMAIGNVIGQTGYILGLDGPSFEGIYLHRGGWAIGNIIRDTRDEGIASYITQSGDGPTVLDNVILRPGKKGIYMLVDGVGAPVGSPVVVSRLLVGRNTIYGENAPDESGVVVATANGGSYADARIRFNDVWGRSANMTPAGARVIGNSWQEV